MNTTNSKLLWKHKDPNSTRTHAFRRHIQSKYNVTFKDYEELRQWSIANINSFWEEVWHFTGVKASKPFTKAVDEHASMFSRPSFFNGARLNFAENLLFPSCKPNEDSYAVIEANEVSRSYVTWRELRERTRQLSLALRKLGVKEGDRIAGYVANHCNSLVAMLATTSIGALWTAMSPDSGAHAVLDRIQQIEPVVLFADNAVMYNGKVHEVHHKLNEIVKALPHLKACVVFETIPGHKINLTDISEANGLVCGHSEFVQSVPEDQSLAFAQLQPDHPVYILYSSGTTGKPKCIVHGAVGTLIQHKKEHDIQCDIRPGDRFFYFTTCTWMMWHWLVSGLATGATLILYDGSPFRPLDPEGIGEMAMPRLIEELRITHFGTSAKYLSVLEQKDIRAGHLANLKCLKAIYSTGSPLAPSTFEYVYRTFGSEINLGSITGGTDIISLFGAPSQLSPVYAGEIQVRGLGMAVEVWDFRGTNVTTSGEPGDLVCVKPFPCQPVMFYGAEGEKLYKRSYFEAFPGVWHHGDFVRVNPETGGLVMLGRSDGVLKPAGVRFGSSEIYNVLLEHLPEIEDALCVGRRRENDSDEVVVLFVKMAENAKFSGDLVDVIKALIREKLSVRHVPGIIDECPEIPVTVNGKKVEVAVKQLLCGTNIMTSASVANSDCLDWYRSWNAEH
ncbi:acetoacetyl-CoA synthetase, partial [Lecanoromycetidae sp. Uapishka_2]